MSSKEAQGSRIDCSDAYLFNQNATYTPTPPKLDLTHMAPLYREQSRPAYPAYFLAELTSAAELISQTVTPVLSLARNEPVIAKDTSDRFKGNVQIMASDITREYKPVWEKRITFPYTPYDYLLYKNIWQGEDIMPELKKFSDSMIESLHKNPDVFWESFYEFGLNNILPYFIKHQNEDESSLMQRLQNANLGALTRAFNLLPDLSCYYDFEAEKGARQKDEYYMQVLYALTLYALRKGECGIASLVEKDGKILSARYNGKTVKQHAEILALEDAEKSLPKLPSGKYDFSGCANFTTVLHCAGCAGFALEEAPDLVRISYSVISIMSAKYLLQTRRFPNIYPRNPFIPEQGVLTKKFLRLYQQLAKHDRTYEDMFRK